MASGESERSKLDGSDFSGLPTDTLKNNAMDSPQRPGRMTSHSHFAKSASQILSDLCFKFCTKFRFDGAKYLCRMSTRQRSDPSVRGCVAFHVSIPTVKLLYGNHNVCYYALK